MTVPSRFAISKTKAGNPTIHTLKVNETKRVEETKIRKLVVSLDGCIDTTEYGSKVIMLIGETGSGKTLMINALLNYVLGVKWGDGYRYKLDPDELEKEKRSQTQSQTEWISVYTLNYHDSFRIRYSITIIDTPGFGDTAGISKDKEITDRMKFFFSGRNDGGIDEIDAVIFVAQSDKPRLTTSQKFVFDCMLSLFGKDIKDNILLFTTFADQNEPLVLEGMKKAAIPYRAIYKFNNSPLYAQKECARKKDSSDDKRASKEDSSDDKRAPKEDSSDDKRASKEDSSDDKSAPKEDSSDDKSASKEDSSDDKSAPKEDSSDDKSASKEDSSDDKCAPKEDSSDDKSASKEDSSDDKRAPKEDSSDDKSASKEDSSDDKRAPKEDSSNDKRASREDSSDEESEREMYNKMFWKSGTREFKKFFLELDRMHCKSTRLSSEVLKERDALNACIKAIPELIRSNLVTLERLKIERKMLHASQEEVNKHSDHTYFVPKEITEPKTLSEDEYAMTCPNCQINCHYPCNQLFKISCPAFYWISGCRVCPQNCSMNDHHQTNFMYVKSIVYQKQTSADVKARYDKACKESTSQKDLLRKVTQEAEDIRVAISKHVAAARDILKRLDGIALKANPTSTTGYLKYLIKTEKASGEVGWQDRVIQLEEMLGEAKLQDDLAKGVENLNLR